MNKIIFCDDELKLKTDNLVEAFDEIFSNDVFKLFYLYVNNNEITIYEKFKNEWQEYSMDKMDDFLKGSYIMFDTRWKGDAAQKVSENIISQLEKNKENAKIFVYTRFSREDADSLVEDLSKRGLNVYKGSFILIDDFSIEQKMHFRVLFNAIKKDYEG